jgi:hypothetical protein
MGCIMTLLQNLMQKETIHCENNVVKEKGRRGEERRGEES